MQEVKEHEPGQSDFSVELNLRDPFSLFRNLLEGNTSSHGNLPGRINERDTSSASWDFKKV